MEGDVRMGGEREREICFQDGGKHQEPKSASSPKKMANEEVDCP